MAPILLKNIANPLGNRTRQKVETMAVIVARICQADTEIRIPLNESAVKIPETAATRKRPKQIFAFTLSPKFLTSHETRAFELLMLMPKLATTP